MTRAYIPRYPVGELPFMPQAEVVEVERSEAGSVRVGLRSARSCIEHRVAIERQVCIRQCTNSVISFVARTMMEYSLNI
jgi:hypothetical protein